MNVQTRFESNRQSFFLSWLEIEFLKDQKVIETVTSPEVVGTQPEPRLLGISARAPRGADSARLSVCLQNKFWSIVDNRVTVSELRPFRITGPAVGKLDLQIENPIPLGIDERTAELRLTGELPDGLTVNIRTSKGVTASSVLVSDGTAKIILNYPPDEVGAAEVVASVLGYEVAIEIYDPQAARVRIESILADGLETPALVQLIQEGKMMPGRYQISQPGIFMKAPWAIDLPPVRWQLRVCRGPEFHAMERNLEIKSGETTELGQLQLERQVAPHSRGWYGGDADGDVYQGEQIYTDVTAETAAEMAQAMGLDWVGVGSWRKPDPKTWGEARQVMQRLSRPNFLFLWTDERPKTKEGHVCFVGLSRPDDDPFGWGWVGNHRALRNFEQLLTNRASGAATFVNHPLRWWTSGDRFRTNMYASLPFDLCAAQLLDGYNVNEKADDLKVWSMLLDHGYKIAATAGADFCLDRPDGPPPGKHRMYCYCPDGITSSALAEAVRKEATIISTGPVLLSDIAGAPPGSTFESGKTYPVHVEAWSRGDEPDSLKRVELWSHGKAVESVDYQEDTDQLEHTFQWQPEGEWDWVAVRVISRRGWAITSAYYAAAPEWEGPQPVTCRLDLDIKGLSAEEIEKTVLEVWDNLPSVAGSRRLSSQPAQTATELEVPVSATVMVIAPDGRKKQISIYDAVDMAELVERIASGKERERPLLNWQTYEEVLERCASAEAVVQF